MERCTYKTLHPRLHHPHLINHLIFARITRTKNEKKRETSDFQRPLTSTLYYILYISHEPRDYITNRSMRIAADKIVIRYLSRSKAADVAAAARIPN